jgi:hypothetical protein
MVLGFLHEHPAQIHHYTDIAHELGLGAKSVKAALVRMVNIHPEYGVTFSSPRGCYMFRQVDRVIHDKKQPMMYEEVGITQDGAIIVRDEKGLLYKLSGVL